MSAIISCLLGAVFIPLFKRYKIGQPILKYVEEHNYKSGTPTMGGVFFILSSIIAFVIINGIKSNMTLTIITVVLGFTLVGFIDDFIKIKSRNNEGLKAWQKFLFQFIVAVISSVYVYQGGLDFLYIPFTTKIIKLGLFSIPLNVLVFLSAVNGVNLTDGLDGLCSLVTAVVLTAISCLILIQINQNSEYYLVISEYFSVSNYAFTIVGGLLGYLIFNMPKASVFMGDTGSLALGGAVAMISLVSGNTLFVPIFGIVYVVTVLSVIIQVLYYKKTKKRIFLMAPLHHHFQHKGHSEAKISYCYALITAIISILTIIFFYEG